MVPKISRYESPGFLLRRYAKCGKKGCRCTRGELHGPYWYRQYRDMTGRLRKHYVKGDELDATKAAIHGRRRQRKTFEMLRYVAPDTYREIAEIKRMVRLRRRRRKRTF